MRPSASEGFYRLLLRAYPKRFRDRYGTELLEVFRAQRREPEYQGSRGTLRFWRDMGWDWLSTLLAARRSATVTTAIERDRLEMTKIAKGEVVMDGLKRDLGFAVRSLARSPGFALIAVLTLSVGIGSNAAVFGVVNSVLLEPLPYGEPDEVITIWSSWDGFPKSWVSRAEYRAYVNRMRSVEDLAFWNETDVSFTDPANPERVAAVGVTANLVDVLGIEMTAGRFFTEAEAIRTDSLPAEVIVISHEAWVRRWSSNPAVVGTSADMNGRMREIIGVMPPGFRMPTQFATTDVADVYFPLYVTRDPNTDFPEGGGSHGWYVAGRLSPGATVEGARAEIEDVIRQVHTEFDAYPAELRFRPLLFSAAEDVFGSIRPALVALFAAVGFVLLIACANVANLMLARSDDRADELAVRAALGAGRKRLVAQLLVESTVLAVVGGIGGVLLAVGGVELFKALNPGNLPRIDAVTLDGTVLGFAAVVTIGTSVLFGALPALRVTGHGLVDRMGRRSERGIGRSGWQGSLVAVELALAVVLVVGAGLMARTFGELTAIEPGFDGENTITLAVSLPTTRYPDGDAAVRFYREALLQVEEIPGVRSVGAIRSLPLAAQIGDWGLDVEGYDESVNPRASGDWQIVAPGYFETIGIPMVDGRSIDWSDDSESLPVAVVNEAFVRSYWPDQEPLGRTFVMSGTTVTVVGVAGDVRHNGLVAEIKEKFYIPVAQWSAVTRGIPTSMRIVARAEGDPNLLVAPIRSVVRGLDPSLALAEVRTVDDVLQAAVAQPRFMVVLMGAFSAIALVLAMVGVYGVISYGVGRRTQEIGVRMALGAMQDQVVGLMVRKGAAMIVVGLTVGLGLAFLMSRYLESLLYGVSATDPTTFGLVTVGFGAVAWLATWIPSRRAARIDPIRALKID
jgi:putative ABC transport system permease protein